MGTATFRGSAAVLARSLAEIARRDPALWQATLRTLRVIYPAALDPVAGDQTVTMPAITDDTVIVVPVQRRQRRRRRWWQW